MLWKLIERHPHIFGDSESGTASQVLAKWDEIKRKQKGQATHTEAIQSIARSLPALWRSDKIIEKAEKSDLLPDEDVTTKRERFIALLDEVISHSNASSTETAERAVGSMLFMQATSTPCKVDPEEALQKHAIVLPKVRCC